jgi:aerobic-type carbon monoxide dehydrogenase small subunit (CoxS/CutS family)
MLAGNPNTNVGEIQEGLAGNLCRCGCYYQITEAVLSVAEGEHR